MACPWHHRIVREAPLTQQGHIDENTAARLVQGLLSREEASAVEQHLDSCSICSALMTELVRIYLPGGPHTVRVVPMAALPTLHSAKERLPALEPGVEVGRYRIERQLGQGGMGVVYVAFDPALGRRIALKMLRAEHEDDEEAAQARDRMLREAHAMARLIAPNVVPVHDAGMWNGRPFIAMEVVDGRTRRGWLREAPRPFQEILRVFREAGEGLEAAHGAGLVHRDFKPENVLVGSDGRARVTDFGLTRFEAKLEAADPYRRNALAHAAPALENPLTRTGVVMGTPAYMAPEQLFGHGADARSDQFAFAASLYEALYGTRPFPAHSLDELRWRLASGRIAEPVSEAGAPGWMRPVLERALSTDPKKRYRSVRELLDTLSGRAQRGPRLHVHANIVLQAALLVVHLWILATLVAVAFGYSSPSSPSVSSDADVGGLDTPAWNALAMALAMVFIWMLGWGPLGVVWLPINIWGLAKRRPWARYSSLLYASFSLPSCLGTPYAIYTLVSLTRPSVKQYFDGP